MSDFFRNGLIAPFQRLGEINLKRLEVELLKFSQTTPISLILPSLYREFSSGPLPNNARHFFLGLWNGAFLEG
jgi:glucosyl-3-phosphoglycerate synthase